MVDLAPNVRVVGAEIRRQRRLLEVFNASTRNKILRECMRHAGEMWRATYVPMRFTDYVKKSPFGYRLTPGAAWKRMQVKGGVFDRLSVHFDGSNPFPGTGHGKIVYGPRFDAWLKQQQAQGRFRFSALGNYKRARSEYAAIVQAKFREAARNWYKDNAKDAVPLMLTGQLSRTVMTGKVTARATTNMASVKITMPRGDRQNPWARRVLSTVPVKEAQHVARWMGQRFSGQFDQAIAARVQSEEKNAVKARQIAARAEAKAKQAALRAEARAKAIAKRAADKAIRQTQEYKDVMRERRRLNRSIIASERLEGSRYERSTGARSPRRAA